MMDKTVAKIVGEEGEIENWTHSLSQDTDDICRTVGHLYTQVCKNIIKKHKKTHVKILSDMNLFFTIKVNHHRKQAYVKT